MEHNNYIHQLAPVKVSWIKRDALLFAISIGCQVDEEHYLYGNHPNFQVFPTYPIVLTFKGAAEEVYDFYAQHNFERIPNVPLFNPRKGLDGQRCMTFLKPLPPVCGKSFEFRSRIIGVYDKGKAGSVIETEQYLVDKESGITYVKLASSAFYVGQGNWGGPKGPSSRNYPPPEGKKPDSIHVFQTTQETPYLYRLNGDYNPLHAEPGPGIEMGVGGTILHGLFTWNVAAHGVLREMARSKAENLKEFQARIASPVKPGDKLITRMWRIGVSEGLWEVRFETQIEGGKYV